MSIKNADKMTIEDLLSDESFINYCLGSSPKDTAAWETYIAENADRRLLVETAKEKYLQLFNALAQADLEEQVDRLNNLISSTDSAPVIQMDSPEKRKKAVALRLLLRIAAAAMIVCAAILTVFYFTKSNTDECKTYVAAYGERKNIQLPDGSIVTLNAGSKIQINTEFAVSARDIYLEGEAFFEVKHDTSLPFVVHTPAMDVKALGTAFNVKAYMDENVTETSLIRGLVEVTLKEDNNIKTLLYPNQKIEWQHRTGNKGGNSLHANKKTAPFIDADSVKKNLVLTTKGDIKEIAWKENKLIFDDEDFENISVMLERWYGAKINFKDNSVRKYRFTGVFEKEDLNTVLEYLKESKRFNYTIEQGEITTINLSE